MAVVVVHPFVNPKADGADATITRPSDWNAAHTITGLGTLATQDGTFSGTSSGTNTGDQTTIVGISGTIAQFNTACTDADFGRISLALVQKDKPLDPTTFKPK